jgi:hypothetical protein
MGQADESIQLGDILDELGIQLPTVDEPTAPESTPEEPTDAEPTEEIDTTTDDDTADESNDSTDEPESTEETDDTEESEEEPEEDAPEPPQEKSVQKLSKRVDKLTARAKSAEEQAAALESELAQTKEALAKAQPIIVQDAADPLADIQDAATLEARLSAANTVLDNVPDLLAKAEIEGGEVEVPMGNGAVQKFTSAQLRERLNMAKAIVRGESNKRAYFAQRETYIAEARHSYPEIFQEGAPLRKVMQESLRAHPALAKLPNLELIIGDAMRGQALRFQQLEAVRKNSAKPEAKAKTAAPAKVAPKVPQPSAAPRAKSAPNALAALKQTGSREAAESFVAALLDD